MTQRSTSQHQTIPEACHKMWTFRFTLSEQADFFLSSQCRLIVSSFSVYLIVEAIAEGVGAALVTDLNVVNLSFLQQHQGVGVVSRAFWAVPYHKCPILKTKPHTQPCQISTSVKSEHLYVCLSFSFRRRMRYVRLWEAAPDLVHLSESGFSLMSGHLSSIPAGIQTLDAP